MCRREGLSRTQVYEWREQLMGSAKEIFADKRVRRKGEDPRIARQAVELQRMKDVIAEITAENLFLEKTLLD